ncbi:hypothetical protein GCM10022251_70530 [Phytohabitans flavus]|uniref:Uncharacterized protein n=1 Tax=Phytohabitans flavus TaxID=1076124 RepID=A0A6F8Y8H5_9ACTN|nr:hypothetical protein Pflav_088340 [Phytohabitans flavus]
MRGDPLLLFQHGHLRVRLVLGDPVRDGETDDPGSDHDKLRHGRTVPRGVRRRAWPVAYTYLRGRGAS